MKIGLALLALTFVGGAYVYWLPAGETSGCLGGVIERGREAVVGVSDPGLSWTMADANDEQVARRLAIIHGETQGVPQNPITQADHVVKQIRIIWVTPTSIVVSVVLQLVVKAIQDGEELLSG